MRRLLVVSLFQKGSTANSIGLAFHCAIIGVVDSSQTEEQSNFLGRVREAGQSRSGPIVAKFPGNRGEGVGECSTNVSGFVFYPEIVDTYCRQGG